MISIRILSNNHDNHEDDRTCPTQGLHKWVCHASSYSTKLDQEYYKYKYDTLPNWTRNITNTNTILNQTRPGTLQIQMQYSTKLDPAVQRSQRRNYRLWRSTTKEICPQCYDTTTCTFCRSHHICGVYVDIVRD